MVQMGTRERRVMRLTVLWINLAGEGRSLLPMDMGQQLLKKLFGVVSRWKGARGRWSMLVGV